MSRVVVLKDNVAKVFAGIHELAGKEVLIGIPEAETEREEPGPTNAGIGYIHEFGSPAHNIPARPFLIPGVEKARTKVIDPLRSAARGALEGHKAEVDASLTRAGFIAEASAKDALANGNFAPLSAATVRARRFGRGTKSMRAGEIKFLQLLKDGMSAGAAQVVAGIRPLINTGQLLHSITHVVRRKK